MGFVQEQTVPRGVRSHCHHCMCLPSARCAEWTRDDELRNSREREGQGQVARRSQDTPTHGPSFHCDGRCLGWRACPRSTDSPVWGRRARPAASSPRWVAWAPPLTPPPRRLKTAACGALPPPTCAPPPPPPPRAGALRQGACHSCRPPAARQGRCLGGLGGSSSRAQPGTTPAASPVLMGVPTTMASALTATRA